MPHRTAPHRSCRPAAGPRGSRVVLFGLLLAGVGLGSGCTALKPLDGIPAESLPPDYRVPVRTGRATIDLSLLRRTPPPQHVVDSGDVLGVYIEGVLGEPDQPPPITSANFPVERPSVGYPIAVREDGTLALPEAGAVYVRGLTLAQVEAELRDEFTVRRPVLKPGKDRVLVSLQRPRTESVVVIRQESGNRQGNIGAAATVNFEIDKRGTGRIVELPVYQNDVLHALAATGGLPGLDAENVIYVIRNPRFRPGPPPRRPRPVPPAPAPADAADEEATEDAADGEEPGDLVTRAAYEVASRERPLWPSRHSCPPGGVSPASGGYVRDCPAGPPSVDIVEFAASRRPAERWVVDGGGAMVGPDGTPCPVPAGLLAGGLFADRHGSPTVAGAQVLRIPVRLAPGQPVPFVEHDVVLHDGDVVFVEQRDVDFFYTGGLLGGGQFRLPQTYDIDVLEALAIVRQRGGATQSAPLAVGGPSSLNQDVTVGGSELIILRRSPGGIETRIEVDLHEALRNPAARVLVRPGDYLILRYTKCEAVGAFFERLVFESVLSGASNAVLFSATNN